MTLHTTVVTMFFDLRVLPDVSEDLRPYSFYMDKGRATLALKSPMVIFCDEADQAEIVSMRGDAPTC